MWYFIMAAVTALIKRTDTWLSICEEIKVILWGWEWDHYV